jgi:hypothetical protein
MDLNHNIPPYITDRKNIIRLILFTAIFALIFINLYSPFDNTLIYKVAERFNLHNLELLLLVSSSLIILTGVLVVVISRIILYRVNKRGIKISIGRYLIWIAIEIFAMSMFYALYEKILIKDSGSFLDSFKISVRNTALVLLLPYSVTWLYFSWIDKNKMLERLRESGDGGFDVKDMVTFRDEKGTMRLSLKLTDLLFIQAADNYVTIVYNHHSKMAKYMLRSSLKLIESEFMALPLIRCHRSYMVNFEKVKIIRREKDGLKIELDSVPPAEIPISKTYMEDVFKAFGHNIS